MNVLVTGAKGFIGSALCNKLSPGNKVIGVDIAKSHDDGADITWEQADLTDFNSVAAICEKYSPDVVIHCAGIAHQKIGAVRFDTYMRVNSEATENLAKAAAESNPDVSFIFLSSVSVYGEDSHPRGIRSAVTSEFHGAGINPQISRISQNYDGFGEESDFHPTSDYAASKLDAEKRLIALSDGGTIHNLVILRLAPVYDRAWSLNLDRRVFAPGKVAYLRFGSGSQQMSALARPNLTDFIEFLIHRLRRSTQINADENNIKNNRTRQNNLCNQRNLRINVCDAKPYEFNTIIRVFKKSSFRPDRPVVSVPISFVWLATRIAGTILFNKRKWLYACYDKLASSLIFSNNKMLETGFVPHHSLQTIFDP